MSVRVTRPTGFRIRLHVWDNNVQDLILMTVCDHNIKEIIKSGITFDMMVFGTTTFRTDRQT